MLEAIIFGILYFLGYFAPSIYVYVNSCDHEYAWMIYLCNILGYFFGVDIISFLWIILMIWALYI